MIKNLKKHNKQTYGVIGLFVIAILGLSVFAKTTISTKAEAHTGSIADRVIKQDEFSKAEVIFPIDNVKRDKNVITLTITENARNLEDWSQKVDISAMKKVSANNISTCPMINSKAIDKKVNSYNPITGSAEISATFITTKIAKAAESADCLLIRNTETQ